MASKKKHEHVDFCLNKPFFCSLWMFMEAHGLSAEEVVNYAWWMKDFEENAELLQAHIWRQETVSGKDGGHQMCGGHPKATWGK